MTFTSDGIAQPGIPLLGCSPPTHTHDGEVQGGLRGDSHHHISSNQLPERSCQRSTLEVYKWTTWLLQQILQRIADTPVGIWTSERDRPIDRVAVRVRFRDHEKN